MGEDMRGYGAKQKNKKISEQELAQWNRVVLNPMLDIFGWSLLAELLLVIIWQRSEGMTRWGYFVNFRLPLLAEALVVILCMWVFLRRIAQRLNATAVAIVTIVFLNLYMGIYLCRFLNQPYMVVLVLFPIIIVPIYKRKELVYIQAVISFVMLMWMEIAYMPIVQEGQTESRAEKVISLVMLFYTLVRFELEIMITTNMLGEQSYIDSLTRLLNHEAFYEELDECMRKYTVDQVPFSLIIIDIDNFKKVNDTYGHAFGDEVIKRIAEIIHENKGTHGIGARYGGEEFAIILPGEVLNAAILQAERIRRAFENTKFQTEEGAEHYFSISLGVAEYDREYRTASEFFDKADKALYEAKGNGKNRVCCTR